MRIVAIVVALAATVVGVALFARAVVSIVGVIRLGRPIMPGRRDQPGDRWRNLCRRPSAIPRMLQWTGVGAAHWFVFVAFGALFFTLLTAYGQLFDPEFALPVIGHWIVYEWASEVIAWAGLVGILLLMVVRFRLRGKGRSSRFFGSRTWQGVFVELVILGIVLCVLTLRALEFRLLGEETTGALPAHLVPAPGRDRREALGTAIVVVSAVKIDLDGLVRGPGPEHHHGRGLAPVHRLAQRVVQTEGLRPARARRPAADDGRR